MDFQILVLFFAFMRKRAWDYGRLALVNKDYEKYDSSLQHNNIMFSCGCLNKILFS